MDVDDAINVNVGGKVIDITSLPFIIIVIVCNNTITCKHVKECWCITSNNVQMSKVSKNCYASKYCYTNVPDWL